MNIYDEYIQQHQKPPKQRTHKNSARTKPRTPIPHDTLRQLIKAAERKRPRHGLLVALKWQLKQETATITDAQLAEVKRLAE